jgi:type VI protein secretion system component VasK
MVEFFYALPRWLQVCSVVVILELIFLAWLVWEICRSPLYADENMRERIYTDEEKAREEKARAKRAAKEARRVPRTQAIRRDAPREISTAPTER